MKHHCYTCKKEKTFSEMYVRGNKIKNVCIVCYESFYLHQCKSDADIKKTQKESRLRAKRKRQQFVLNFLKTNSCLDCGERNIIVLQFDHGDPKNKSDCISNLISHGSLRKIKEEIEKCDIVCSNCHLKRTAKMFGNWRLEYIR